MSPHLARFSAFPTSTAVSMMERKDFKRKAQEISESPQLVSEKISELTNVLAESDAILRAEISELSEKIGKLKKQLTIREEECIRLQEEVAFFHPDAIIDRVRTKLWHHGDLSLLRRAIEQRSRVLRSVESRGDRSLYLCDTPSKKSKPTINGTEDPSVTTKPEKEEASTSPTATTELGIIMDNADTEEKDNDNATSQLENQLVYIVSDIQSDAK
ncbi:uncharacterized protein PHALS_10969 [Plasmopara halstedii]|uniref:Uncharacterized protein n=1 Tax=Plasmopara halstedii TaxID=4781 RepID=A0A0P1AIF0_PLAHL|nr:uncharacterized protein PHALS_10969 [Plasmopara halstedii]CEG40786.1 hypothetical protein PHALS_10969 [Plasmopara halstedii]|eukprot:XP_024577155.1 hypothetical protein PHALS_10969 [Plasmopara halstedii]